MSIWTNHWFFVRRTCCQFQVFFGVDWSWVPPLFLENQACLIGPRREPWILYSNTSRWVGNGRIWVNGISPCGQILGFKGFKLMEMKPLNGCVFQIPLSLMNFSLKELLIEVCPWSLIHLILTRWIFDGVVCQGCRFVPYTFSDTLRQRWYQAGSKIGFQGLAAWFRAKSTTLFVNPNLWCSRLGSTMQRWIAAFQYLDLDVESLIRWKFGVAFTPFGLGFCWL